MKKILISLLISSTILLSLTSCGRFSFFYNSVTGEKMEQNATVAESVDSDYVSYEEIIIDNEIPDPPLLYFTSETASFAREIIKDDNKKAESKKSDKDNESKKSRQIVEKRTFGYDDDTVKDMEITFYLPAEKYSEKEMQKYGKNYESISFAAVNYQPGNHCHVVTITFADLELPENIKVMKKSTDLVVTVKNRISMKKTSKYLENQKFSKKF